MENSVLITIGQTIIGVGQTIKFVASYIYLAIFAAVVVLLLLRALSGALNLNPFGSFSYYATRPGNDLLRNMRNSRFYYPLKRALGFDPAIIMVLVATAIVCYVVYLIIDYFFMLLTGLGRVFIAFGSGNLFTGIRYLIGTLLLAIIFYLLALMLLVFVNWIFGLFNRLAYRALNRIAPLLRIFEFGGIFAGWSFLILGIALSFAASAVQLVFFS